LSKVALENVRLQAEILALTGKYDEEDAGGSDGQQGSAHAGKRVSVHKLEIVEGTPFL
jgi:hypothetical protein